MEMEGSSKELQVQKLESLLEPTMWKSEYVGELVSEGWKAIDILGAGNLYNEHDTYLRKLNKIVV